MDFKDRQTDPNSRLVIITTSISVLRTLYIYQGSLSILIATLEINTHIVAILQVNKLRHRKDELLVQGHTASK